MYYLYLFLWLLYPTNTWSKSWTFDQVIQQALQSSRLQKIIYHQSQADTLILSNALSIYDWTTGTYLLTQNKKWQNILNPSQWSSTDQWNTSYFLRKKFAYGSSFQVTYSQCALLPSLRTSSSICLPNNPYGHQIRVGWEQSILRNFFGRMDRLQLKSTIHSVTSLQLSKKKELEQMVIQVAQKFWEAYSSYIHFNQTKKTTKDYKELVRLIKRKTKLGHNQPGELSQILSQYEIAIQTKKQAQTKLQNAILELRTLAQIKDKNMYFKIHQPSPLPLKKPKVDVSSLTMFQIIHNQYLSEMAQINSQKYSYLPFLKLKADLDYSHSHTDKAIAFKPFKNNQYMVGLELTYPIPSSVAGWKKFKNLKSKKVATQLHHEQEKEELLNQIKTNWNTLTQVHSALKSAQKISKLQKQALKEVRKSYIQGRIDFHSFIQTQSKNVEAELSYITAQKTYHLSLLKFYSLHDQLLTRYQK